VTLPNLVVFFLNILFGFADCFWLLMVVEVVVLDPMGEGKEIEKESQMNKKLNYVGFEMKNKKKRC